jgi:hypothetical protein
MITIQAMLHIDSGSFTLNQFNYCALIPSGFRPSGLVNFSLANIVPGSGNPATTPIRSNGGVGIINGAVYGTCAGYIDPSDGTVYVRINSVSSYASLGGTSTVVIPINITYFINVNT